MRALFFFLSLFVLSCVHVRTDAEHQVGDKALSEIIRNQLGYAGKLGLVGRMEGLATV